MKGLMKRVLAFTLAFMMIFGVLPVDAWADTVTMIEPVTITHVNPIYADVVDESDLSEADPYGIAVLDDVSFYSNLSKAAAAVRELAKARTITITIGYVTTDEDYSAVMNEIWDTALMHTGEPTEGDYLKWHYAGWEGEISGYVEDGTYYLTFTYVVTYYTTASQEAMVTAAVESLVDQLETGCTTDYEKIKAAYNYICLNVDYDNANLNNEEYKLKYTAYAALINKTSVCQGYALLLYRLMLEMGIDCRLISGTGNGGAHGWNLIELDGDYYNADSTWDANKNEANYDYFLKGTTDFGDHSRDNEFETVDFCKLYPMPSVAYAGHTHIYATEGTQVKAPTCVHGKKEISCTVENCNAVRIEFINPIVEHVWDEGTTAIAATCVAKGQKIYTCTNNCGTQKSETLPVDENAHSFSVTYTVDEETTCTKAGSKSRHCTNEGCEAKTDDQAIGALGHDYEEWRTTKEATCNEAGEQTRSCKREGCEATETEAIAMTEHKYAETYTVDREATCNEAGSKSRHCINEGCEAKTDDQAIGALGHAYEEWRTTKEATCNEAGEQTRSCKREGCGSTKIETIAATGIHTWSTPVVAIAATLSMDGSYVKSCSCGISVSAGNIPMIVSAKLSETTYTYNKKTKKPTVIVKDSAGKTLTEGTDYTTAYAKGRKDVGEYDVNVTFAGKYAGTKTLAFSIVPRATKLSSLKAGKKKLTVKWKKQTSQTMGYQIQYGLKSNFKGAKIKTINKNKTTSLTISSLKSKKTYYVRIRTYKEVKVNGKKKKIYSAWSASKKVKVK